MAAEEQTVRQPAGVYPSELESTWVQLASRFIRGGPNGDIAELQPDIARISDVFTTGRNARFGNYAGDSRTLAAYGLFFFPQTYARMAFALAECITPRRWLPAAGRPLRILDIGAGTGAATFAALFRLEHALGPFAAHVDAVDASSEGLRALTDVFNATARARWPHVGLTCRTADLRSPAAAGDAGYDLILASFVLNELMEGEPETEVAQWMDAAVSLLAPGGLLVITEPVSNETSTRLERLRDAVATAGQLDIIAPCLHRGPCPLLAAGEVWCHEVRTWTVPDTVAYLNRRLHRSVETVKYSLLALTRRPPEARYEPDARSARLVAPMHVRKGCITTWGCAADGAVHPYEVQTRALTRPEIRAAERVERGSRVRWGDLRCLGDGKTLRAEALPTLDG
jgi:ribosomal protein RSM22 (predicted rRNA methylase)